MVVPFIGLGTDHPSLVFLCTFLTDTPQGMSLVFCEIVASLSALQVAFSSPPRAFQLLYALHLYLRELVQGEQSWFLSGLFVVLLQGFYRHGDKCPPRLVPSHWIGEPAALYSGSLLGG